MDKYKLYNTEKRALIRRNIGRSDIQLKGFSFKLIKELFQNYVAVEYVVSDYCCYGEDHCCWQEVDGEGMGWSSNTGINKQFEIEKNLRRELKRHKTEIYGRKIIYVENSKMIWIKVPLRDLSKSDHSVIFDKTRTLDDLKRFK